MGLHVDLLIHNGFTEVNVTLPFHDKVWKDLLYKYKFNKLRYRDRDALLTTRGPHI